MTPTVAGLVAALRQAALLEPPQLAEVERLAGELPDGVALSRELLRRQWVTPYQLKQVFLDKGNTLVLGQYVVLDLLGEGGMGQVFKARHRRLDRLDALKVIRADHLAQPDALRRFQREARAVARLNHPNIVTVYDADEVGGTHFIAMEYVEGVDLARIVRSAGPLNIGQATDYVRQAALGLQHAHEKGLVHRDIKPANLLVTADATTVKILDLGLARLHNLEEAEGTSALTRSGVVMGTPDYMAPEQALDSSSVDIRADVYSLGCTLYFLLCGTPPFPPGSLTQKLLWHQQSEPEPLETKRPDLPPELLAVVRKMMAKEAPQRYQTPAEAARALEPFVHRQGSRDLDLAFVPRPTAPVEDIDGFVDTLSGPESHPAVEPTLAATVVQQPTHNLAPQPDEPEEAGGINWYPIVGSIGFLIAAVALFWPWIAGLFAGRGSPDLPKTSRETTRELQRLDHNAAVWSAAFLPDGQRAVTASGTTVAVYDLASGTATRKLKAFPGTVRAVACSGLRDLVAAGCVAGRPEVQTLSTWTLRGNGVAIETKMTILALALSPDDQFVVAAGGRTAPEENAVFLWETATGKLRQTFLGHKDFVTGVAFARDGTRLASCSRDSTVAVWEMATPKAILTQKFEHRIRALAFLDGGKELILGGANNTLGVYNLTTKTWADASGFQGHTNDVTCVAVSPDGQRLLSGSSDRTARLWDIATRRQLALLEGHTGTVTSVAFSPDGQRALSTSEDKTARLWQLP